MTKLYVSMLSTLTSIRDERGATMPEYGLMVALIAVVCIGAVTTIGTELRDTTFAAIANAVN